MDQGGKLQLFVFLCELPKMQNSVVISNTYTNSNAELCATLFMCVYNHTYSVRITTPCL